MNLITGHNLIQPAPIDAPLEFNPDPDLVDKCREALAERSRQHNADAASKALEAHGFVFVRDDA